VDHLAPPPDLPAKAREIFRLWSVKDDVRTLFHASQWPDWDAYKLGEALSAVAADFVHARERKHLDSWQLKEDSDNLRLGLTNGLSRAHVTHDPQRYDEWGCPFKTRVMTLGAAKDSVLAKDFPELFERVNDDETAVVYSPSLREFGITVLDGGPSVITVTHDPFSGKALPSALRDEWFATVEKLLGRPYAGSLETPVPVEFDTEAWWIERGL
jgi:hypothetical protein